MDFRVNPISYAPDVNITGRLTGQVLSWNATTNKHDYITVSASNIYNSNDSLTGIRTVDLATFTLAFTNGNVGIGATPAVTTRFDIRAQGALSTNIALRVRNSANTTDLIASRGDGQFITRLNNPLHSKTFVIGDLNTINKGEFTSYENGSVVGFGNTMNTTAQFYIYGNNNSNATNGAGVICGYANTNVTGNIFGSSNANRAGNTVGNSNTGMGNVFGNANDISQFNGNGGSSFVIGNSISRPNDSKINNTIFFGSRDTLGVPYASLHRDNFMIGEVVTTLVNYDLAARGVYYTKNSIAPATLPTDTIAFYSSDAAVGNACFTTRSELGHIVKLFTSVAYTPTNVVTTRTFNANATNLDELADVLGTFIADMQANGLIG